MSALTERITEVIYGHRFDVFTRTCSCSDWMDSGPGANRVCHNHAEHVAERVEAELGLTAEPASTVNGIPFSIRYVSKWFRGPAWLEVES